MFSIKQAVSFGWNAMKENFGLFLGTLLIIVLLSIVSNLFGPQEDPSITNIVIFIIIYVISMFVNAGLIKMTLKLHDGEQAKIGDLFSQNARTVFNFFIATILYVIIVFLGTILFIIPGIILGLKYWLYNYLIIDKGLGPIAALKQSGELTRGFKWQLFKFGIVIALINIAGALLLLVGLIATVPTTWMATAYVYRALLSKKEGFSKTEVMGEGVAVQS